MKKYVFILIAVFNLDIVLGASNNTGKIENTDKYVWVEHTNAEANAILAIDRIEKKLNILIGIFFVVGLSYLGQKTYKYYVCYTEKEKKKKHLKQEE